MALLAVTAILENPKAEGQPVEAKLRVAFTPLEERYRDALIHAAAELNAPVHQQDATVFVTVTDKDEALRLANKARLAGIAVENRHTFEQSLDTANAYRLQLQGTGLQ